MLSIEATISAVVTVVVLSCILLNVVTLLVVSATTCRAPRPWDVVGMLQECFGALMRKVLRKKSYHIGMSCFEVFGLNTNTANSRELEIAQISLMLWMRQYPWLYTKSQLAAVKSLTEQFHTLIIIRIRVESITRAYQEEQLRAKKQAYQKEKEYNRAEKEFFQNRPKPAVSGWRKVLGVSDSEREVGVIKQAYRKKALAAHPDRGGSNEAMAILNQAIAQARRELSFV